LTMLKYLFFIIFRFQHEIVGGKKLK
jgi:hypothetical protein